MEGYQRQALSAADLLLVDDHLAACEACRSALYQLAQCEPLGKSLLADLTAEANQPLRHLAFEELEAYVSESLPEVERQIITNHLHLCSQCREEAEDLLSFKVTIDTPAPPPTARAIVSGKASQSFVERLKDWMRVPAFQWAFQITAALAIVAIAIFFFLLPSRREAADLRAHLNRLEQENAELQKQSATLADLQAQLETLRQENEALEASLPTANLPASELAFKDAGGSVSLDGEGALQGLTALSSANQQLIKQALQNGRLVIPEIGRASCRERV